MSKPEPPFFVGYLPTPQALARFYQPLVLVLVVGCAMLGYWLGAQQKPGAPAVWAVGAATTMSGVLQVDPYPVLHRVHPEDPARIESVLLVRQGKFAATGLARELDGKAVDVTGARISRGGWTMLEVSSGGSFAPAAGIEIKSITDRLGTEFLGKIVLAGEIVDSKCFLGVMKPGAGAIHKSCAEVCLLGGIPSMLVAKASDDRKYGYILVRPDGSPASALTAKLAGEAVRITGELERRGDLLYLRMAENGLERI